MKAMTFGEKFKASRLELRQTLREFCRKHGFDPGRISKLERGRASAPKNRQIVLGYARALKLPESDWQEFCDMASISAGRIPPDLTYEEVAEKLPVLFEIGREFTRESLERLAESIRNE